MPNIAVVGGQWGDEGKGKVVDLVSSCFDVVARYQGGPNAGHTVVVEGKRHALHHVPSAVFHPDVRLIVGNGTVLRLSRLIEELEGLEAAGVSFAGRLFLSDRAHVILPILEQLDAVSEEAAGKEARIGTTLRGIGPAYEAKAARRGVRLADLMDRDYLVERIRLTTDGVAGRRLREAGLDPDAESLAGDAFAQGRQLAPYVAETSSLLNQWMDEGKSVLFEGAQGALLDVDHGTYPYVTSSNTVAGGLCAGLGVGPTRVDAVLGVFKAYATRVGSGPMPTEKKDADGEILRERGREYGTTTGRPRRCGWFDAVTAAQSARINHLDAVCVTLLDVLDAFPEIRICTAYRLDGRRTEVLPACVADAQRVEPVYETLPGWKTDTTGARRWEDLPSGARRFLDRLGKAIGAEVTLVGVGPDRTQSIVRPGSWLARELGL